MSLLDASLSGEWTAKENSIQLGVTAVFKGYGSWLELSNMVDTIPRR